MKNGIRFSIAFTSICITVIATALIGISIWANQPRGIKIDLNSLKDM